MQLLRILICVVSIVCCRTRASDWPQFRGIDSLGASDAAHLPTTWDDTTNIAWRTRLPGYGASSPISLGDRLYVTCYSGYGLNDRDPGDMNDLQLHLVAINGNNGSIVWSSDIKPTLPESDRVRDHGYAAATPATDGEAVFTFFGKSGVIRFGLDGRHEWRTHVGDGTHGWGCGTSPVLFEHLVIVNASVESGSLVALDKKTGREVWRAGGMERSWNTPHLVRTTDGNAELVVSVKDKILAFDPATGHPLWQCEGVHDYVCPSIISLDSIVYVIGGRKSQAIAVRAGGRGDVTASHRLWVTNAGANVSSPVIHRGHLYWVSDRNSVAYCVDITDGNVVYQERFPAQPYASTIVADNKLYVVTRFKGTYVLAAEPEFRILSHNEFSDNSTFNASPIVAGNKLIIRSNEYLYAVGSP